MGRRPCPPSEEALAAERALTAYTRAIVRAVHLGEPVERIWAAHRELETAVLALCAERDRAVAEVRMNRRELAGLYAHLDALDADDTPTEPAPPAVMPRRVPRLVIGEQLALEIAA